MPPVQPFTPSSQTERLRAMPSLPASPVELAAALQTLTQAYAELEKRLHELESRERLRDARFLSPDLGIDY